MIMRIRSPLADLVGVLEQVKQSAHLNESILAGNEAATRAALIDPVLRSLGWDTGNPVMVEVEKSLPESRADYALFDTNGDLRVVIEAKSLGSDLEDDRILRGSIRYAYNARIGSLFLTNGMTWHHLTKFDPQDLTPTMSLDLGEENLIGIASYLVEHLDAAHFWPDPKDVDELALQVATVENTVATLQKELERLKADRAEGKLAQEGLPSQVADLDAAGFQPLAEVSNATGTKPSRFRLPDGTVLTVSSWSEVLRESAKFAMEANPKMRIPFPDKAGKQIALIGLARPPKSISYNEIEHSGTDVFIRTNYSANGCIENALHVLGQVPGEHIKVKPSVRYA